jgi:Septum formation
MRGWILRIAIIGAIGVGAFIFRDRLSGNAGDLKVGDCFDVPAAQENIKDVQHHPCGESHTAEVIALLSHPAAKGAPPPSQAELLTFLTTQCGASFVGYTGIDANAQGVLDYGAFYPVDSDWNDGDRGVTCYAYRLDEAAMTGSVRKAP